MKSNLVLIGYRGTGKSTVAALLGARLGRPVVKIDEEIARADGRSIPEIVAKSGWEHFRDLETRRIEEAAARTEIVIDAGGGAILRPGNVAALRRNGFCVWLTAEIATIAARIGGDLNRPSLTGRGLIEEIGAVLAERSPLYRSAADLVVATDAAPPEEIATTIVKAVSE